jgi:hypothetical protein
MDIFLDVDQSLEFRKLEFFPSSGVNEKRFLPTSLRFRKPKAMENVENNDSVYGSMRTLETFKRIMHVTNFLISRHQ